MIYRDDLLSWQLFLALYKNGSIQKTATKLDIEKSMVSKRLVSLEKQLGRTLFDRTSRPFRPTPDADAIYEYAEELVKSREKIERYYMELQEESHVFRVMMGNSFRSYGPKLIDAYFNINPKARINVVTPIVIEDFLDGKADITWCTGHNIPTDCVYLKRRPILFIACASPEYIKKHGPINTPNELAKHRTFSNMFANRYTFETNLSLKKGNALVDFTSSVDLRFSSVDHVKQAAMDGLGVAISLPLTVCIEELMDGRLVPILDGWHRPCVAHGQICKIDDWKIRHIRIFTTWFTKELRRFELECEKRLASKYGEAFIKTLSE